MLTEAPSLPSRLGMFMTALCAVALIVLTAPPTRAGVSPTLTFGDSHTLGTIVTGVTGVTSERTALVNHLKEMTLGESKTFGGQTYSRSSNSFSPLPTPTILVSGTGTTIDLGVGGYAYLFAKYDGPNDGAWVWYVGDVTGFVVIPSFSPESNGISGWSLFSPDPIRPDGRIRRSGGPLRGNNIYNGDPGQTVSLKMYAGDFRHAFISIKNDGNATDTFTVAANAGSSTGFTIRYFVNRTSIDVTAAVEAGTFVTPSIAPGNTYRLRVSTTVSRATPRGSEVSRTVSITADADDTTADAVGFIVKRK